MKWLLPLIVPLLFAEPLFAQPDLNLKNKRSVVQTGSGLYRFETFTVDSRHRYNITLAIPKQRQDRFAVLYMLDGNAVLDDWDDAMFELGSGHHLPVLVCIGYETGLRFDVNARTLDYTPGGMDGHVPPADFKGRSGGGADTFAGVIATEIKPKVETLVKIDKKRQGIWGHSYGGLFVLNALFRHTEMFSHYYVADPSLWFAEGLPLRHKDRFLQDAQKKDVRLTLMTGNASSMNPQRENAGPCVADDAAETMFNQLKPKLADAVFLHYDLPHGAMFGKSMKESIRLFSCPVNSAQ